MQVDTIVKVLTNSQLNFVICIQPHKFSGLCELFKNTPSQPVSQKLVRTQLRGYQVLDFLLQLHDIKRARQLVTTRNKAVGDLTDKFSDSLVMSEPNLDTLGSGLASSLWHGLQVGMMSAVTNLDLLEGAVTGLRSGLASLSSVTSAVPTPDLRLGQVLDDTGIFLLQNGKLVLRNL